jgi:hypothetical protein
MNEEPVTLIAAEQAGSPPVGQVMDAKFLHDGRIVLIDGLARNVRMYDAAGNHLRVVGRQGQGPGEFTGPVTLQPTREGGFIVYDRALRRMTEFDSAGSVGATVSVVGGLVEETAFYAWQFGRDRIVTWEWAGIGNGDIRARTNSAERIVSAGRLRSLNMSEGTASTLLDAIAFENIREGTRIYFPRFGVRAWASLARDQIVCADGARHEVHWVDPVSGARSVARFPSLDAPFDDDELERLTADHRAIAAAAGQSLLSESLYDMRLQPEIRPALGRLSAGPDGTVWAKVFHPEDAPSQWWIASVEDGFRGRIQLPDHTDVLSVAEEHLLLRRLDEVDVPRLEVWPVPQRLRRREVQ